MNNYESSFVASAQAEHVLRSGRIIDAGELPADMVNRVVVTLAEQELAFTSDPAKAEEFARSLGVAMDAGDVVLSTPIMTNAGRYTDKPLTACTVPSMSLNSYNTADLTKEITLLHEQGMGTGFNLNDVDNPTSMLKTLNAIAVSSANSGREDRPVGNMAVLSIYHPGIVDFIDAKVKAPDNQENWKFNISVDVDEPFMAAARDGRSIALWDGTERSAAELFDKICEAATLCADPGLVFLDRMNARNPYPGIGEYKTTAPCAEVGLIEGETCQFGYVNIGNFIVSDGGKYIIDYARIATTVCTLTRALDNALELSMTQFATPRSQYVMSQKRKIGIGLCGVADLLTMAQLPYDSDAARTLMGDVVSFINYISKEESIRLAEERGSCGAMTGMMQNRHLEDPPHIAQLYSDRDTATISGTDWRELAQRIADTRLLRNISTIALPPTGRSALVIDASTGVEPHFSLPKAHSKVLGSVDALLVSELGESSAEQVISLGYALSAEAANDGLVEILASARQIRPLGHLLMAACLQRHVDEAISKTVNLSQGTRPDEVRDIYLAAHEAGMSGITVYVDGTHQLQPKAIE